MNLSDKRIVTNWMEKNNVDITEAGNYYDFVRKKRVKFTYDEGNAEDREKKYKEFIEFLCDRFCHGMKV